jgi:hypothetical protein
VDTPERFTYHNPNFIVDLIRRLFVHCDDLHIEGGGAVERGGWWCEGAVV